MKWVKLVDDSWDGDEENKLCYKYVTPEQLKEEFGVWAHYRFPPEFKVSRRSKKDYETFIGGFLLFYDDVVRNCVVDHAVYLKWEPKNKLASGDEEEPQVYESVTVAISPKPQRKDQRKYPSVHTREGAPAVDEYHQFASLPGYGDLIDPPPPPPPPPPSLDDELDGD